LYGSAVEGCQESKPMSKGNEGFLSVLACSARESVRGGYYDCGSQRRRGRRSLVQAVESAEGVAIIAEVKFVSPADGKLRGRSDAAGIAEEYERGGAVAVSVLTERKHFGGELEDLAAVKGRVGIPVLMKDVIVDKRQVDAAGSLGADAVLLIAELYGSGLADSTLDGMIDYVHSKKMEVLLEAHSSAGYERALRSGADLVGINNRDLKTLRVSVQRSVRLLGMFSRSKPVVCESGLVNRGQIVRLGALGADAFLVGSALMKADDREGLLRELRGV
jgi:indole-3-glycerol phosphate synthase